VINKAVVQIQFIPDDKAEFADHDTLAIVLSATIGISLQEIKMSN